jgi:hypothetical protein
MKLRGLVPKFHIHVPVSDLYVYSHDRSTCSKIGGPIVGVYRVAAINPEHFQSFTVALKIKLKKILFPQTISAVC